MVNQQQENILDDLFEEPDRMGLTIKEASMKGVRCGVQAWILQINPKAFYMTCVSHIFSLIICDAIKWTSKTMTFFVVVQQIYVISSATTKWYDILQKNEHNLPVGKNHVT